jgi:hypothetical protein
MILFLGTVAREMRFLVDDEEINNKIRRSQNKNSYKNIDEIALDFFECSFIRGVCE